MTIKNLNRVPASTLAETFNHAFSDYITPISLTEKDLLAKIISENTQLELSAGAFDGDKLVGFILTGIDEVSGIPTAYNGGTGVMPQYRGQNLTVKMYDFLLPLLAEKGITRHQLEVITDNERAIHAYEKIGFTTARRVTCFKGTVTISTGSVAEIQEEGFPEENEIKMFRDFSATYQNSWSAIMRTKKLHRYLAARVGGKLVGFIVFAETSGRIRQFAVGRAWRNKGIGHQLFYEAQKIIGESLISLINVEDGKTLDFLATAGLMPTVSQYEMMFNYSK